MCEIFFCFLKGKGAKKCSGDFVYGNSVFEHERGALQPGREKKCLILPGRGRCFFSFLKMGIKIRAWFWITGVIFDFDIEYFPELTYNIFNKTAGR